MVTTLLSLSQETELHVQGLTWFWFQSASWLPDAFSLTFKSYKASPESSQKIIGIVSKYNKKFSTNKVNWLNKLHNLVALAAKHQTSL